MVAISQKYYVFVASFGFVYIDTVLQACLHRHEFEAGALFASGGAVTFLLTFSLTGEKRAHKIKNLENSKQS